MSHFNTCKLSFLYVLLLLVSVTGWAQKQDQLPAGVQALIFAEQHLLSRDVNEKRILTPRQNSQDDQYKPEKAQIFEVKSYWLKKSSVKFFESAFISERMKSIFVKDDKDGKKVLMLVHPESESLFREFLEKAEVGPRFWATSTASSRTLLMWPDKRPDLSFFGKLSLNKEVGGSIRTIPPSEVARSLGTNEVLFMNEKNLPKSFRFMPESLSLIPNGFERGGMIIREIPADVASGKSRFIPLFSLYASRWPEMPLLAEMINRSGLTPNEFVQQRIINPFVKQWTEMVVVHGISMEPHAQNVLIGLDKNGQPNGQFMHRDFGGFNMDLKSFRKLQTARPAKLPSVTTLTADYHQMHIESSINQGIETYFDQGFVFNLDQKLPMWAKRGWIPEYRNLGFLGRDLDKGLFSKMIYTAMAENLAALTQNQTRPTAADLSANNIHEWIKAAREHLAVTKKISCTAVFF